jgi:hypothetical protein
MVKKASESQVAFQSAHERLRTGDEVDIQRALCWKAPITVFVKVNWDANVDKLLRKMGIGEIVKDCSKEVLATLSTLKMFITDSIVDKAFL